MPLERQKKSQRTVIVRRNRARCKHETKDPPLTSPPSRGREERGHGLNNHEHGYEVMPLPLSFSTLPTTPLSRYVRLRPSPGISPSRPADDPLAIRYRSPCPQSHSHGPGSLHTALADLRWLADVR